MSSPPQRTAPPKKTKPSLPNVPSSSALNKHPAPTTTPEDSPPAKLPRTAHTPRLSHSKRIVNPRANHPDTASPHVHQIHHLHHQPAAQAVNETLSEPLALPANLLSSPPLSPKASPVQHAPHVSTRAAKDGRRLWTHRELQNSGVSHQLLSSFDDFIKRVPNIPSHVDPTRHTPVRNMRAWILKLEDSTLKPVWQELMKALRNDTSAEKAWGSDWDYNLCRFILGKLVSEDQDNSNARNRQSRQAVNNAIKRELTCPIESGSSSRSKTFRDLFREKCREASVPTPLLESAARLTHASTPPPELPHDVQPTSTVHITASVCSEDDHLALALRPPLPSKPYTATADDNQLAAFRESCQHNDEWGLTAWWKLKKDSMVKKLPFLLAAQFLFQLRVLLLDFRWIVRTFQCVDFSSNSMRQELTIGYDKMLEIGRSGRCGISAVEMEGFRLIRNAMMVIIPILRCDPTVDRKGRTVVAHLATQLVGRLLNHKRRFPNVASLIQSIEKHAPRPWLRPLTPCFQEPRTDVKLAVPSNGTFTPHLIELSEDGSLLATSGAVKEGQLPGVISQQGGVEIKREASYRKVHSIQIWDVESGKKVCTIDNITNVIRCLALSRDNKCVMGETVDGLFFWWLERKNEMLVVMKRVEAVPKPKAVTSITPTVNINQALTTHRAGDGPVITLWNTANGIAEREFEVIRSAATCIDVSSHGDCFASGHKNGYIHLWNVGEKWDVPVLSFKNEGTDTDKGQQHTDLEKVQRAGDLNDDQTVSISLRDDGEERWLATGSSKDMIRIWLLPPRMLSSQAKKFVNCLLKAVLPCGRVREVQWSKKGWLFSGGDDGVAKMWSKDGDGHDKWGSYAIDKCKSDSGSDMSAVLMSSGKRSNFVATYVTKSPYVTVWDVSRFEAGCKECMEWTHLYRPHFSMVGDSVDATDIVHLTALNNSNLEAHASAQQQQQQQQQHTRAKGMSAYGENIMLIRSELQTYIRKLDPKISARPVDEMQTRMRLKLEEWDFTLEICFEQPVIHGVSGTFMSKEAKMAMYPEPAICREGGGRRGMVAALQDGSVVIFELEGSVAEMAVKDEQIEETTMTDKEAPVGGENRGNTSAANE